MTHVDPANAHELAAIAREIGAEVLAGHLRYPSASGGWQLGEVDLSEYLARQRDRRLVLVIAAVGDAEPETFTCGICGFVMDRVQECPRCRLEIAAQVRELEEAGAEVGRDVLDQVRDLLDEAAEDGAALD